MSSYWGVDNIVQIGETKVEIPAENGLSFSGGQKVSFNIPADQVKFIDGKNSYFSWDVKIALPAGKTPTRLQLDEAGGNILVKNCRIYSGNKNTLIEEIIDWNCQTTIRYDYDVDASKRNLRALEEGGTSYSVANRGTLGSSKSYLSDTVTNPYFVRDNADQTSTDWSDSNFTTAKCCVPLVNSGIFTGSIYPNLMSGLYIELDLERPERVIKQLDSATMHRRLRLNPVFFSTDNDVSTPADWASGASKTVLYLSADQNLIGANRVERCPFVRGETIGLVKLSDKTIPAMSTDMKITSIEADATSGLIKIGFAATTNDEAYDITSGNYAVFSTAVDGQTSYPATYTLSNVNLVINSIELDPAYERGMIAKAREGQNIEFDIMSTTTYKNTLLASDRQTAIQVHANNRRAKALLIQALDSSIYTSAELISSINTYEISNSTMDITLNSARSGMTSICDQLSSVQYQIDGKLVPSRPISTSKCATGLSIDAFHLFELEKGLDNSGITPRSFARYLENFVLSRGFATNRGAMDLTGKDVTVLLKYEETTAPTKNKMINTYVTHVRKLIMSGDGSVEIEV